ncbi:hypothetical protein D3C77_471230 [compost metagenome]
MGIFHAELDFSVVLSGLFIDERRLNRTKQHHFFKIKLIRLEAFVIQRIIYTDIMPVYLFKGRFLQWVVAIVDALIKNRLRFEQLRYDFARLLEFLGHFVLLIKLYRELLIFQVIRRVWNRRDFPFRKPVMFIHMKSGQTAE